MTLTVHFIDEKITKKSGKSNMNFHQLRYLNIEIYKTVLNPSFTKKFFEKRKDNWVTYFKHKLNLNIPEEMTLCLVLKALILMDQTLGTTTEY